MYIIIYHYGIYSSSFPQKLMAGCNGDLSKTTCWKTFTCHLL